MSTVLRSSSSSAVSDRGKLLEAQVVAQQTQIENLRATIQALRTAQTPPFQLVSAPLRETSATEEELDQQRDAGRKGGHLGAQYGNLGGRPSSDCACFD